MTVGVTVGVTVGLFVTLTVGLAVGLGVPLSRLHVPDIATEVLARGIAADISGTTIWRWLSEDAIRPWRSRSWIFLRDPNFEAKARRVLDLSRGKATISPETRSRVPTRLLVSAPK